MESQTYDSLPRVPDQWMDIVKAQVAQLWPVVDVPHIRGGGGGAGGGGMLPVSKNKWQHPNPNFGLLTRWKTGFAKGYKTIGDLKTHWAGLGDYVTPNDHSGNEICLKCQLTGECKIGCGRSNSHLACGDDVIAKLHQHLDHCGVPN